MPKNKVLLGMSGGIDSCMAAILLRESGYKVVGATLSTYLPAGEDSSIDDAAAFAKSLGIKHVVLRSRGAFKREVIDYFTHSYQHGYTPNPCVRCNYTIKWPLLLESAQKHGCHYIATGHYVNVEWFNDRYYIKRGYDKLKDQSYYMWRLGQDVLERAIFPLGHYSKSEIQQLAIDYGLPHLKRRKESNSVCFLENGNYGDFLKKNLPADSEALTPGLVIDYLGNHYGDHPGFAFFTIGQKRGLTPSLPVDWCVVHIDANQNVLIVGPRDMLYIDNILLYDYTITPDTNLWDGQELFVRVRGLDSVPGYAGRVDMLPEGLLVKFDIPVWAITPGQSIVIYNNDILIGGGEVPEYDLPTR